MRPFPLRLIGSSKYSARWVLLALILPVVAAGAQPSEWQAGMASVKITPEQPAWMTGYGSRDHRSEGTLQDLYVKALALRDSRGKTSLLLTADLCGIPREISDYVASQMEARHGIGRDAVLVNVSHTHCSPFVDGYLMGLRDFDEESWEEIAAYTGSLKQMMLEAADGALRSLTPVSLASGTGSADFGVNRRNNRAEDVPQLRATGNLKGPVDHDVPTLALRDASGKLTGVVFAYACHNTTLSFYQWNGDYAGFAQEALQERHPGALAFFAAGCGADINPLPRREVELVREYGNRLADAVDRVLQSPMTPVAGQLITRFEDITLRFASLPSREELTALIASDRSNERARGKYLLRQMDAGTLDDTYAYPIQVWKLGNLTWVALGGEVVVDYALRLKRELGPSTWVLGYSNDVMAYIPSERVLQEGGYEGASSMHPYARPGPWAPGLEDQIVGTVKRLAGAGR